MSIGITMNEIKQIFLILNFSYRKIISIQILTRKRNGVIGSNTIVKGGLLKLLI